MENEKILYIATLSGGKDSVTMVDLLLKNNYPVDYIVFNDTKLEFEEMYRYMENVKKYLKEKYNKEIITLKPEKDFFKDIVFGRVGERSKKYKNYIRGSGFYYPNPQICQWRRESKVNVFNKWLKQILKENNTKNYKLYIGYTTNEIKRKIKDEHILYPLIDNFKMSEKDCLEYTKKINLFNSLYNHFKRTGCSICPFMKKDEIYILYKHYPNIFNKIKIIENKLKELAKTDKVMKTFWFLNGGDIESLEKEFKRKKYLEERPIF